MDGFSLVKYLEKFDSDFFLCRVRVYMTSPVQYTIVLLKEFVVEYKDEILNADFLLICWNFFLENSLMEFSYFHQSFGMGTHVNPVFTNNWKQILKEKAMMILTCFGIT